MAAETTLPAVETPHTSAYAGTPLAGYAERFAGTGAATGGAVVLAERPLPTLLTLRTDPRIDLRHVLGVDLPPPGLVAEDGTLRVLGLGPDEWLLVAPPGEQRAVAHRVEVALAGRGVVVDVSGQHAAITLAGPKSREVLATGCSLDLHPQVFHDARCARTMPARAGVVLAARRHRPDAFTVLPRSSYARYVADRLLDAASEYRTCP